MRLLLLTLLLLGGTFLSAQDTTIPMGTRSYEIIERLQLRYEVVPEFNTDIFPYSRRDVLRYALQLDSSGVVRNEIDRADLAYLFDENNEWVLAAANRTTLTGARQTTSRKVFVDSTETFYRYETSQPEANPNSVAAYRLNDRAIARHFYRTPANLGEINREKFYLRVNPVLNLKVYPQFGEGDESTLFENTRGVRLRAGIDDRVFVYTDLELVDAQYPQYVREFVDEYNTLPRAGLLKNFESRVFNTTNAYSYLRSQAYLGFNFTESIGLRFGNQSTFIGDGYRSLMLSDYAFPYFSLQLNWQVWRFHLRNIFAELNAVSPNADITNGLVGKKYMAAHYLSFRASDRLSFGLFEAVIFERQNQFELQYLNPVIIYRSVEQAVGSPDNALLGLTARYDALPGLRLYSQLLFDEFKLDRIIAPEEGREGWWGNKYGLQLGASYQTALSGKPLRLNAELNLVRPFMYAHRDSMGASYTHNQQPLAHPAGSNFRELILRAGFRPAERWFVEARYLYLNGAVDPLNGNNLGNNLLRPTNNRFMEYGNDTGQGVGQTVNLIGLDASYEFYHGLFFDLSFFYRERDSVVDALDNKDIYLGGGIRMNMGRRRYDF